MGDWILRNSVMRANHGEDAKSYRSLCSNRGVLCQAQEGFVRRARAKEADLVEEEACSSLLAA